MMEGALAGSKREGEEETREGKAQATNVRVNRRSEHGKTDYNREGQSTQTECAVAEEEKLSYGVWKMYAVRVTQVEP